MALEIVERLFAVGTLIQGFAGRGSKLAQEGCVGRMATRTNHVLIGFKQ